MNTIAEAEENNPNEVTFEKYRVIHVVAHIKCTYMHSRLVVTIGVRSLSSPKYIHTSSRLYGDAGIPS